MRRIRFGATDIRESAFRHPKLRAVRNYVRDHIADVNGPTLPEVAGVVCLSPKHFSVLFKQHVGVSFSVWRSRMKIERAKELFLRAPWISVGVVAVAVGYQDPTTFTRAFKRYEGMMPRQYREIVGDLADWRPSASSRVRRRLIDGITQLTDRSPAIVRPMIELVNVMHRLGNSSRVRSRSDYRGDLE